MSPFVVLRFTLLASCAAPVACSYEEVLPLKDAAAEVGDATSPRDGSDAGDVPAPDAREAADQAGQSDQPDLPDQLEPADAHDEGFVTPDSDERGDLADSSQETSTPATDAAPGEVDSAAPSCGDGRCDPGEGCLTCDDCACPERCGDDLFFSEYVEGTGWNKALEIANFTGRAIDLQSYAIWKINNGGDWSEGLARALPLTGLLAHGDVLVVCHGNAAAPLLAVCDLATTVDLTEFNGDDALALTRNGAIVDVIGSDGADPGVGWTVAGVPDATADHTLRRKVDVLDGSALWTDAESTWDVLGNDVIGGPGGLGALRVRAHCSATVPPRAALNEIAAASDGIDFVEVAAFAGPGQDGVLDIGGWLIASTSGRYTFPADSTLQVGGFLALSEGVLGFDLGLVDRVWLYDDLGALQDVVGWHSDDLAGASLGRLPDLIGAFAGNSVATPGAPNRDPETWCGDGICQPDEHCGSCSDDCPLCQPGPGDLVISELMAEPTTGPEWFELVNVAGVPLELADVVVRDEANDFYVIAPGGSFVLAADALLVLASAALDDVPNHLVFSGMSLSEGPDQIILERDGVLIDAVVWTELPGPGIAASLSGDALSASANDIASAWCAAVDAYGEQLASPGLPNRICAECGDGACDLHERCDTCAVDCGACVLEGCAEDLFFSQYIEGTSYNKAIEIANHTGVAVDLSRYAIWRIINGGSTWAELGASSKVALAGTLAAGEVWVGCNTSADAELKARCDALYGQGSAPTNFNGDDALALVRDGILIDMIGAEAVDPGAGWVVDGVPDATVNHTLVRRPTVARGNLDWGSGAAVEWSVLPEDDFSGVGTHDVAYRCEP